jgi:3-dehydroquinate dehydratase/shikimate dehydrogenase
MTQVCETVTATTMAELRSARDAVVSADLVELRLDGVRDVDVAGALAGRTRPVIVTCRPVWEGGRFDGGEEARLQLLAEAMRLGAEFVDVELRADRRSLPRPAAGGTRVVLSLHDFQGVPADLADRVRAMRAEQPAVVKVAVMAQRLSDCLTLRAALPGDGGHVAIAMGAAGQITRLWPAGFGSCWTYGGAAAPGQTPARDLAGRYRVRTTTASTQVYAVAGSPLGHSASPAMHNAAFARLSIDAVYVPLETADVDDLLAAAEALSVAGISITAPLKQACAKRCASVDSLSAQTGAVNTLHRSADGWHGRNFDVPAFLHPLDRRGLGRPGDRALVLGAGGAARAVVAGLVSRGLGVHVAGRTPGRAQSLAQALGATAVAWPPHADVDLLVNTTPVGAWPDTRATPIDASSVRARVVYDLVYNPVETTLLRQARAGGAAVIGGLEMLVNQARQQSALWTGRSAPADVIDRAAREFLSSMS